MWQAADGEPSYLLVTILFIICPFVIMVVERITRDWWDSWKRRK